MSWLARLRVPYAVVANEKLRDGYAWHCALWKSFPGRESEKRDFLTRVEKKEQEYLAYILSSFRPECPGWCPPDGWAVTEIKPTFLEHDLYRFELFANPTRKIAKLNADGTKTKNGRRVAFLNQEDQLLWLQRKAEAGGFRLFGDIPVEIGKARRSFFKRHGQDGSHYGVNFRGLLGISDRQKFKETFYKGIGTSKGFGFGLLMLQPVAK